MKIIVAIVLVLFVALFAQVTLNLGRVAEASEHYADRGVKMLPIPFEIHIDPMERLLLINIENDPDTVYVGFEPQVFDDNTNGKGNIVIGWRVDGRVDVFHQPGLVLDPDKYSIAGKGLAHMVVREMADSFYNVDEAGVQAYFSFEDMDGRTIELKVNEYNSKKRKPFGLLAPMGEAAENPSAMPLVMLHDFYFVRQKDTNISVTVDGKSHNLDKLPFPLNWSRMYFTRYSPDPLIATLNPAFEGTLPVLEVGTEATVIVGDTTYEIAFDNDTPELKSFQRQHQEHVVNISFEPAFPNLLSFTKQGIAKGNFSLTGHPSTGKVEGHYTVERVNNETRIVLVPSQGWIPQPSSFSLRVLYAVAKIFRDWPKSYQWTATVIETEDKQLNMSSSWIRLR